MNKIELKINHLVKDSNNVQELHGQNVSYIVQYLSSLGIDKKDINHIFDRFYKGKNSTPDSVGIGLSLAKAIIEKDNGTINVESSDKGSSFIIKYFN